MEPYQFPTSTVLKGRNKISPKVLGWNSPAFIQAYGTSKDHKLSLEKLISQVKSSISLKLRTYINFFI